MRSSNCIAFSIIAILSMASSGCAQTSSSKNTPTPIASAETALQRSFQPERSSQVDYAKDRNEGTFYMGLEVISLYPDLKDERCVDQSFFSWFRKFFKEDSARITLVAELKGPGEEEIDKRSIPLFEVSRKESPGNSPNCLTDILQREITPLYRIGRNQSFEIDMKMLSQKDSNVTAAQSILKTADGVLKFSGADTSAWLVKKVAATELLSAAHTIDESLANNWSLTNQRTQRLELRAWPKDNDWAEFKDQITFSNSDIISNSMGITVTENRIPTVIIKPVYSISLFGNGPGEYISSTSITTKNISSVRGKNLDTILLTGLDGVTTDGARTFSDTRDMELFATA